MNLDKVKFINEYNPSNGGSFVLNELYNNKEGFTVDDFKDNQNSHFDRKTGKEYICGFPVIYQITSKGNIPSIFKNGFDRAFTGSKGGNMYGPGVYSTYRLDSTKGNINNGYGDTFVKMLVLSKFKDFLIFDRRMAQRIHGDGWRVENQLIHFFGEKEAEKMKHTYLWKEIQLLDGRTAPAALAVWQQLAKVVGHGGEDRSDEYLIENGVAGFIFKGNRDGYVSVIRDFKNILPIAYSIDQGKTWKNDAFTQDTVNTIFYDVDGRTFYGKDVRKYQDTKKVDSGLNKRINDLIMVKENGKYNFIDLDRKKISPLVNFDTASPVREDGKAFVTINDPRIVKALGEPFEGYISKDGIYFGEDEEDLMSWDNFNNWLKKIK